MTSWAKTILSLTLICYLTASNAASVHAFSSSKTPLNQDITAMEMSADCHTKTDDGQATTVSTCKIFCSAMSNVIIDDAVDYLPSYPATPQIVFLRKGVTMLSLAKEPPPPK